MGFKLGCSADVRFDLVLVRKGASDFAIKLYVVANVI